VHPLRPLRRQVDVRLPGKGNSNSHGARPVHLIITMTKWIRTSRLSIKNSLSLSDLGDKLLEVEGRGDRPPVPAALCDLHRKGDGSGFRVQGSGFMIWGDSAGRALEILYEKGFKLNSFWQ